jgi:hypothetical protein
MSRAFIGFAAIFFILGTVNTQSPIQPPVVNNLIVSAVDQATTPCELNRLLFLRTTPPCSGTSPMDACNQYMDQFKSLDYHGMWTGGVVGVNIPAGFPTTDYSIVPYPQAMDGPPPVNPSEPCIDKIRLINGPAAFKRKSYSYFVYDMTSHRGCLCNTATLTFNLDIYYSGSAQASPSAAHIGVYDMNHNCENLTNDPKRGCFGSLVSDPEKNPVTVNYPVPLYGSPGLVNNQKVPYSVNVKSSVQADLYDPAASGYVGFMFASNDIDTLPGMRSAGMTDFVLTVTLGACGYPVYLPLILK